MMIQRKTLSSLLLIIISLSLQSVITNAQQYTFKCGTRIYVCGSKVTSDTMCVPGAGVKTIVKGNTKECQGMQGAIKAFGSTIFTTNKYQCPNGELMNHHVTYNSLGKMGRKCDKHGCAQCKGAHCGGDPHFLTYEGVGYTYHGQCDLVMAHTDNINDSGLSLDVHARTTIIAEWSYISETAIRIGNDILEITSKGEYFINGQADIELPYLMGGHYPFNQTMKEVFPGLFRTDFLIDLEMHNDNDGDDVIRISAFKDLLSVTVDAMLPDTYGMLGLYGEANLYGRDLTTVIEDTDVMGQEWQVRNNEPQLFRDPNRQPQYPTQCILPKAKPERRLRLSKENEQARQIATIACNAIDDQQMKEFCIQDVMLTGDSDIAIMYT